MTAISSKTCAAFFEHRLIASGAPLDVAIAVKEFIGDDAHSPVLIFDDDTSEQLEFDFRGTLQDVCRRLSLAERQDQPLPGAAADSEKSRGRGRPRLGVVSREVTLLPRHWDWLGEQPGGASVALRKLVEKARHDYADVDARRRVQERAFRFMNVIAGNLDNFEDAIRSLYAADKEKFATCINDWPKDISDHCWRLTASLWQAG